MRSDAAFMATVERREKFEDWSRNVRLCVQRYEHKTSLALARAAYRAAKGEPPPRSGRSSSRKTSTAKGKGKGKGKGKAGSGVVPATSQKAQGAITTFRQRGKAGSQRLPRDRNGRTRAPEGP